MRLFKILLVAALIGLPAYAVKQIQTADIANSAVTNAKLANSSATIAGTSCTLGSSCSLTSGSSMLSGSGSGGFSNVTIGSGLSFSGGTLSFSGSTSSYLKAIAQTGHGFSVGDVVYYTGSAYAKAKADADSTSEVIGIVSAVADANNFTVTTGGYVSGLSGLTAGTTYYLSDSSAGALTATQPTTVGYISKPVLVADSTSSGYFFNFRGVKIAAAATPSNVTSASSGNERIERLQWYGNSGATSGCGSSPCTIASQSGSWVTSVSRSSTGTYTINIAAGEFSAAPTCVMVPDNLIAGRTCQQSYSTSTSTAVPFQCYNASSTLTDVGGSVLCMGPK